MHGDAYRNLRLTVDQFLIAMGHDNRFYTSLALNKQYDEVTEEDCVKHFINEFFPPYTPQVYEVEAALFACSGDEQEADAKD